MRGINERKIETEIISVHVVHSFNPIIPKGPATGNGRSFI